jgi:DNA-binding protein Fis
MVLIDDDHIDAHHLSDMAMMINERKPDQGIDQLSPNNLSPHNLSPHNLSPHNLSKCINDHIGRYFDAHEGDLPTNGIYDRIIAEVEKPLIMITLSVTRGNQLKAAEVLGINRNTLRKKIITLGIDPKSNRIRHNH